MKKKSVGADKKRLLLVDKKNAVIMTQDTVPTVVDWNALRKTAAYLEKAKLADYVEMMNHPWKSIWLHFVSGMARGAGIVIGGSVIGVLLVVLMISGLKTAFLHAGGVPWIGDQVKDAIGWILEVIRQHGGGA